VASTVARRFTETFSILVGVALALLVLWDSPTTTWAAADAKLENLAARATITATSEHSDAYQARFVADGQIPAPLQHGDVGKAWCAKGNRHPGGVELTFEWAAPETVAEIVYFGRTAWEWQENWKDYEIYANDQASPVARGTLAPGHGPQRIALDHSIAASRLTLKFLTSYGGSNPGASEILVLRQRPSGDYYDRFSANPPPPPPPTFAPSTVPESESLARRIREGHLGFTKLVAVQRHPLNPTHVYTYHVEGQQAGGGLCVIDVSQSPAKIRPLVTADEGLVLDANLSYDGRTILFSWKRRLNDKFQLYTIGVDGNDLRQLTNHDSNNLNGCWLPDGGIAFLSDRKPAFAYCWTSSTPILYRCDRWGDNVIRLSANYLNDFTPSVMSDGKIIYSRWEYVDRPAIPIQSLWSINPDGTGLAGVFGNRVLSPATFMEAHQIPGSSDLLCVLTAHNGPCRGAIGRIDPGYGANAQSAIQNLTPEVNIGEVNRGSGNHIKGLYESPFPIDDQFYLVSRGGTLVVRDYAGTAQATLVSAEDSVGFYTARPVMPRPVPPRRAMLDQKPRDRWATVLVQNVYEGLGDYVRPGEITHIAVVQEVEKSKFAHVNQRAFGFQFPVVSCGATYAPKKVWGFAAVESDGSACFKVPTGVPIYFMALDRLGRAVQRMRTFTHLMPGERQSCVGCHADRSHVSPPPVSSHPLAAQRQAETLQEPDWGVRGFSYSHIVQPIWDRHCVECHHPQNTETEVDLTGDRTDFFNVSYEYLARLGEPGQNPYTKWIPTFNGQEANILQITPKYWGSPASQLAEIILSQHPDADGQPRIQLSPAEQRRVFTWIDLDVPYYGTSESNHYDLPGCRQLLPAGLDGVLHDVASRRCVRCHDTFESIRPDHFLRITRVQDNRFLLAPLAKSAGGTQRCGEIVFESQQDPDYRAILATFDSVHEQLKLSPRMDMLP
jgi:hypothetical protein